MKTRINAQTGSNDEALLMRLRDMGFAGLRFGTGTSFDQAWINTIDGLHTSAWTDASNIYLLFGGHMTKGPPHADRDDGEPWEPEEMPAFAAQRANDLRTRGMGVEGEAFELGNEPDLAHKRWKSKKHARELACVSNECAREIRVHLPDVTILSPGISNLNKQGFDYLERMLEELDPAIGIAFHRYPNGDSPHISHKGFPTRNEEFSKLFDMAAGRDVWCTETGFSNYGNRTEAEQADYIDVDMRFNSDRNLSDYTLYQLNDGAYNAEREDRFGIRHFRESWRGEWKELARRLPDLIKRGS